MTDNELARALNIGDDELAEAFGFGNISNCGSIQDVEELFNDEEYEIDITFPPD